MNGAGRGMGQLVGVKKLYKMVGKKMERKAQGKSKI